MLSVEKRRKGMLFRSSECILLLPASERIPAAINTQRRRRNGPKGGGNFSNWNIRDLPHAKGKPCTRKKLEGKEHLGHQRQREEENINPQLLKNRP